MAYSQELLRQLGMTGDTVDAQVTAGWFKPVGRTQNVGGTSVRVHLRDNLSNVMLATGTTVPVNGGTGYAKGAVFNKTDAAAGMQGTYINAGTPSAAQFVRVGDVRTTKVTLTNAQIKALRATPVTLVAAPGANLLLEFVDVVLVKNAGANALVEATANLVVRYTGSAGAIVSETIEATGFIDQTAKTMTTGRGKIDQIVATANSFNQPLVLHNTGAGEYTGNAANDITMDVHTSYRVLDVS